MGRKLHTPFRIPCLAALGISLAQMAQGCAVYLDVHIDVTGVFTGEGCAHLLVARDAGVTLPPRTQLYQLVHAFGISFDALAHRNRDRTIWVATAQEKGNQDGPAEHV